jgi:general secretion pathway protein G
MNEQPGRHENNILIRLAGIMLVFFSLFILAGIVLRPSISSGGPRARSTAAKTQISSLETALSVFKLDNEQYPPGANGLIYLTQRPAGASNWQGPYIQPSVLKDPWGHEYIYECPGRHNPQGYDVSTIGPDGQVYGNWAQK